MHFGHSGINFFRFFEDFDRFRVIARSNRLSRDIEQIADFLERRLLLRFLYDRG